MIDGTKLVSRPNGEATVCWLAGLFLSYFMLFGETSTEVASHGALCLAGTFAVATGFETVRNWKALLRPDIVALLALYGLTFFEFLLPQPEVNEMVHAKSMHTACALAFLAFGSMVVGRHFAPRAPKFLEDLVQRPTPPRVLLTVFWLSFFLGTFYMLLAVNFNVLKMIDAMMGPRFTQPWGRGRYGDARALLNELGAMVNLVPPVAGLILSNREKYRPLTWMAVALVYAFCLFMGLAGSTRNVLAAYLITFLIAYSLSLTRKRILEFGLLCVCAAAGFFVSSKIMLETRTVGLKGYLRMRSEARAMPKLSVGVSETESFFVDLNLVNVAQLAEVFPSAHDFLGLEVPYVALTHPIPRALWPGKPEGLSVSMEDALGVDPQMTISSTYIGEAYMAGGALAVVITGLLFGALTGWWARFAVGLSSGLGLLIYASGFLAIAISMRSLYVFSVAILPTIAAMVLAMLLNPKPRREPRGTALGPLFDAQDHHAGAGR
ncbi:MAG: oligosaccharide repeat unit polymerase [Verrucomicrobia bacterium]|nr:oligosaccharide repeat unit polymerase [Verrucomicrobiota bacterium]